MRRGLVSDVNVPSGFAMTLAFADRLLGISVGRVGAFSPASSTRGSTPPDGIVPPPFDAAPIGAAGRSMTEGTTLRVASAGCGSGDATGLGAAKTGGAMDGQRTATPSASTTTRATVTCRIGPSSVPDPGRASRPRHSHRGLSYGGLLEGGDRRPDDADNATMRCREVGEDPPTSVSRGTRGTSRNCVVRYGSGQ